MMRLMKLVEWACDVEARMMYPPPWEDPPLIFTHWLALVILIVYALLCRLGLEK